MVKTVGSFKNYFGPEDIYSKANEIQPERLTAASEDRIFCVRVKLKDKEAQSGEHRDGASPGHRACGTD